VGGDIVDTICKRSAGAFVESRIDNASRCYDGAKLGASICPRDQVFMCRAVITINDVLNKLTHCAAA